MSKFRPILPASNAAEPSSSAGAGSNSGDNERSTSSLVVPKPKRTPVYTACNHCRKRKIKCDGRTPACSRCVNKRLDCEYDIEPDVSRQVSLKRKYEVMQDEASQLKELYRYLHDRPENEAVEIMRRIRTTTDPIQVLRFIKEGDLLIQGLVTGSPRDNLDPRARRLDDDALEESAIKTRARPWTTVAHDGIVSELISSFFAWEQPFYFGFVDKDRFLGDLASEDLQKSRWCSPLLVNAMCALRCFTSERAGRYGLVEGKNLGQEFLDEARNLFDLECGKASIATVQALLIMYICSSGLGRDRAGLMFRYTAYEMMKHLKLEKWYEKLSASVGDGAEQEQMAISRMLWGVFCFESISAFAYLKPSLVPPPRVAKHFSRQAGSLVSNEDIYGNPFGKDSVNPPLTPGILTPMCELSEVFCDIMDLYENEHDEVGTEQDLSKRLVLFERVRLWGKELREGFRAEKNFTPQTCYLRCFEAKAIIGIFRPLDTGFHLSGGKQTAGQMCIESCARIVDSFEEYERRFGFREYSMVALFPLYDVSMTLVSRLAEPNTQGYFSKVCGLILGQASDYPFASYLLKALFALAKQLKLTLPPDSVQYFKAGKLDDMLPAEDVPISFVIPQYDEVAALLATDDTSNEYDDTNMQLGQLISKWNSMSLS